MLGAFWIYRTTARDHADNARLTERVRQAQKLPDQQPPLPVFQEPAQEPVAVAGSDPTQAQQPASADGANLLELQQRFSAPPPAHEPLAAQQLAADRRAQEDQASARENARARATEADWRNRTLQVDAALAHAFETYRAAVCREKTAGIPVGSGGGYLEARAQYISARRMAEGFEESARAQHAGQWVALGWSHYLKPLSSDLVNVNVGFGEWRCD